MILTSVWSTLTFSWIPLSEWYRRSFLFRTLGYFAAWRQGSWLLQWSDGIGAVLISLVLLLVPFVPNSLTAIFLLAVAAFWGVLTFTTPVGQGITPTQLLVTLYWGIATIATVFSPVPTAALSGLLKLTLYILFFALAVRILRQPPWRNRVMTVYLLTAMVVSAYGIRQAFLGARSLATWVDPTSPLADTVRVYSYLGNPNLLAGYLIPAVCFSIAACFAWQGWGCKALGVGMSVLNLSALVLTYSRGGWIGCVIALLLLSVLLLYWFSQRWSVFWQTWAVPLVLLGLSVGIALAVLALEPLRVRVLSIFAGREDSSNNFRINVWAAVIEMIRDRPWLGIGPGNSAFNKIYPLYQRPRFTALSAYSIFLELAVETGAIGLLCFSWLLFTTLAQAGRYLNQARQGLSTLPPAQIYWLLGSMATIAGMLGHGLVDTVWYRPQISTLWWFNLGLIASYAPSLSPTSQATHLAD
ncbi:MAG: IctB family putative bicarbonate transporter [Prochlorotrichaceae cyanobacterium]